MGGESDPPEADGGGDGGDPRPDAADGGEEGVGEVVEGLSFNWRFQCVHFAVV